MTPKEGVSGSFSLQKVYGIVKNRKWVTIVALDAILLGWGIVFEGTTVNVDLEQASALFYHIFWESSTVPDAETLSFVMSEASSAGKNERYNYHSPLLLPYSANIAMARCDES